jgi:hypothetical protein
MSHHEIFCINPIKFLIIYSLLLPLLLSFPAGPFIYLLFEQSAISPGQDQRRRIKWEGVKAKRIIGLMEGTREEKGRDESQFTS